ncbi:glycosyltransferase [Vibrio sp. 10N.222.51.C12]|uniref:glycosyltransferase n=1 Tax=Vibrio sp. 10N.222.51.C12 TaxID=3229622 RepID=UPI00354DC16E
MENDDKKKVTLIATRNSGGGASRIIRQLANSFDENNVEVTINYIAEKVFSNEDIWPTINQRVNVEVSGVSRSSLSLPWLYNKNKGKKGTVICFGRTAAVSYILTSFFSKKEGNIYIWEGKSLSDAKKGAKGIVGRYILPMLVRLTYSRAEGLIGISDEEVQDFGRQLNLGKSSKLLKIYTPAITSEHFDKIKETLPDWYREVGCNKTVITAAGSFIPQKNFSMLIEAFSIICKERKDIVLILMGDGPERNKLEGLADSLNITDDVKFTGYINNPLPIIAEGDCFVLSSSWEGLPGVLIEAIFCETRIVATNCPSGPSEILDEGKYGFLTKVNDKYDMANNIRIALSSEIPQGLRERSQIFSETKVITQYMELLK